MQRCFDHTDFDAHNLTIQIQLQTLLRSRETTLYGRQYTYLRLKQIGMPLVRDRIFQILKELDPSGVPSRCINLSSRPRGAYLLPGPNFVSSIDGHHKLSMYGIEIYASIDAFSSYGPSQLSLLFSISLLFTSKYIMCLNTIRWAYACMYWGRHKVFEHTKVAYTQNIRQNCRGLKVVCSITKYWPLYCIGSVMYASDWLCINLGICTRVTYQITANTSSSESLFFYSFYENTFPV